MVLAKITIWSEIRWSASLVHMIKWCENDFLKFTLFDLQNRIYLRVVEFGHQKSSKLGILDFMNEFEITSNWGHSNGFLFFVLIIPASSHSPLWITASEMSKKSNLQLCC